MGVPGWHERASLPGGLRLSDYLNAGVIARIYRCDEVREALARIGRGNLHRHSPPAEVMVYQVIAMALFPADSTREVLRCLLEGLRWVSPELLLRVLPASRRSRGRVRT